MCLLGRLQSKTLISPNAGEDVEKQELPFIAGEDAKWKPCKMEDSLEVSYKANPILPHGSATALLGICP